LVQPALAIVNRQPVGNARLVGFAAGLVQLESHALAVSQRQRTGEFPLHQRPARLTGSLEFDFQSAFEMGGLRKALFHLMKELGRFVVAGRILSDRRWHSHRDKQNHHEQIDWLKHL
jgi:hypothetical protein